ncbi:MAG: hypothetical protein AAF558_00545 [Verrucomicrobiota bacterium]
MRSSLKAEFRETLSNVLLSFKDKTYPELLDFAESQEIRTFFDKTSSGSAYQIEIQAFLDDSKSRNIRVTGDISPDPHPPLWGFIPLYLDTASDDFIMTPEGKFVNE